MQSGYSAAGLFATDNSACTRIDDAAAMIKCERTKTRVRRDQVGQLAEVLHELGYVQQPVARHVEDVQRRKALGDPAEIGQLIALCVCVCVRVCVYVCARVCCVCVHSGWRGAEC